MIKLLLKVTFKLFLRKKNILIILIACCLFYKVLNDMLSFSNKICQSFDNDEKRRFNFYEISLNKLLCNLKFNEKEFNFNRLELQEVLIIVRHLNEQGISEIRYVYETWYQFAISQAYVFSDYSYISSHDIIKYLSYLFDSKLVLTKCKNKEFYSCCNFEAQLDLFFKLKKSNKWLCNFNDYNYVNIPNLINFLSKFDHGIPWFISQKDTNDENWNTYKSLFETYESGFCLSQKAISELKNKARNSKNQCDYLLGIQKFKYANVSLFNKFPQTNQIEEFKDLNQQV